ncbi:anti-anti-sigma regulatory factor [Candidatus Scalindua japonica]|uniref:Anti-anti-sigma regulatory factor n=1 Tax=Candidatus Scalindua japonica TaxID=1284222 RepID=A0A286TZ95_9BACT|nr:hypothetical protein [Candidatus Scalindua japonica]GAX61212.1 anti-anti-sigma regulatory factor [Candidatus Scalindua japonica]
MKAINLSEKVYDKLKIIEGKEIDEKIFHLLETNALLRLKECEEQIFRFEARYGMDYKDFKTAWEKGAIKRKRSHPVERDFMEWEGFESERKKWLNTLKEIKD